MSMCWSIIREEIDTDRRKNTIANGGTGVMIFNYKANASHEPAREKGSDT